MIERDWLRDVEMMHAGHFGDLQLRVREMPAETRRAFLDFRVDFLQEELDEMRAATVAGDVVDALVDLVVVALGTMDAFGVDGREAWRRVHEANVAKVAGTNKHRSNRFGLPDLVKPPGWVAPTHADLCGLLDGLFPTKGVAS